MAKVKGRGNWLDRTTEDGPLPIIGKLEHWELLRDQCPGCKQYKDMLPTGRRAMKGSKSRGDRHDYRRSLVDGQYCFIMYEIVCQECGTAQWTCEVMNSDRFARLFGPGVPAANPLVDKAAEQQRALEEQRERARQEWAAGAPERARLAAIRREQMLAEQAEEIRVRNYEPPEMLGFDPIEEAFV